MNLLITIVLVTIISYILGSLNSAVIISHYLNKSDIRNFGSGNAGTTNMFRIFGLTYGMLTFIADLFKTFIAVFISYIIAKVMGTESRFITEITCFFVIIGHNYPIFYEFKGGKGVVTSIAAIFILNFQIGLICLLFGLIVIGITRTVSLGSIFGIILLPILTIVLDFRLFIFGILICMLILYKHKDNITRILEGTESKLF